MATEANAAGTIAGHRVRDDYWQGMRGRCIVAVIWIHARNGSLDSNFDYWITSRQVMNFPVAIFLFAAGYFIKPSSLAPAGPWLRKRTVRLLIPFYLWSLLYTLASAASGGDRDPLSLMVNFLFGRSAGHLYFVLVLVQLTLITPVLARIVISRWAVSLFLVTPLYLAFLYWAAHAAGALPSGYATAFLGWFAFYYAGMWVRFRRAIPERGIRISVALVLCALVVSITEAYVLIAFGFPVTLATSQLKLSSVLYAFALINLALTLKSKCSVQLTPLVRLGDDSYGIYYVHMVGIVLIERIASGVPQLAGFPVLPLFQVFEVAVTLILSYSAIWGAQRVLGVRRAASLLGF